MIFINTLIKNEKRNIHSTSKNIKTTKSVETKKGDITSGEQLNIIFNEGKPSHKSNLADNGDKSSDRNKKSQNESGTHNRKRTLLIKDNIERY